MAPRPDAQPPADRRTSLERGRLHDVVADGAPLPPHTAGCMVCGPDNAAGFDLHPHRDGDDVVATYRFGAPQTGAPGLAHGGAVSAVCDDLLGHVLSIIGVAAVTRRLEVDYLRPVVLGERHDLRASLDHIDGRKIWIELTATGEDGAARFAARGLFISVGWEHFLAGLHGDERERAEAFLRDRRTDGEANAW